MEKYIQTLEAAAAAIGQETDSYVRGLSYNKPVNYWEYIQVDTLLSLQNTKTWYKDETVFIVYHQVTELVLKLIRHELEQICKEDLPVNLVIEKTGRMMRYTDLLISSFSIMNKGMSYEDYNQFRLSLAPASGFQSAQFRLIEIMCTDIDQLIPPHNQSKITATMPLREKFEYVYWQEAGYNRKTGKKTKTLEEFEQKYMSSFVWLAEEMRNSNLNRLIPELEKKCKGNEADTLRNSLKMFDKKFNIEWPMVHLETARTYLKTKEESKAATGGSEWEKYLHPQFQRRIFFPALHTEEELQNWGRE